jgi:DNA ligase (NAD+)
MNHPENRAPGVQGEFGQPAEALRKIEQKAAQIALYKARYYQGQAVVPDDVYDALEAELRHLSPAHPILNKVGFEAKGAKVIHNPPMLSLEKTYDPADAARFLADNGSICVTDKLDGMALSLEYGADGTLFRASTRGNGSLGENVTDHVLLIPAIPKIVKGFARIQSAGGIGVTAEVRGEVFFPLAAFELFSQRFDSFRNAVPGTFGRKDPAEAAEVLVHLGFCAYDVILRDQVSGVVLGAEELAAVLGSGQPSHVSKLRRLEECGFWAGVSEGRTTLVTEDELAKHGQSFADHLKQRMAEGRPYAIDGLVLRCDDDARYTNLGATAHHPRGSLAFKQSGETAVTEISSIHMGVGRSGKISFRAELRPVFLSGATLGFATLHNAEFIELGGYAPGASVCIKRSGEVIPYIISLESPPPSPYPLPEQCLCGSPLTRLGPDLYCNSNPECPYKDSESLLYFVQSLEIYGVSDKILEKLRSAQLVTSPADLFALTFEDLMTLDGFGPKLAQNVLDAIAAKRVLGLGNFLTSLGLKRGGKVKCAAVANAFGTLERVLALTAVDLVALDGWADKSAQDFVDSLHAKRPLIEDLLHWITVEAAEPQITAAGFLAGKRICITGSLSLPRNSYEARLRAAGAQLSSTVTAQTDYLVCNEASSSSKYRSAVGLGVPVISEGELQKMLDQA